MAQAKHLSVREPPSKSYHAAPSQNMHTPPHPGHSPLVWGASAPVLSEITGTDLAQDRLLSSGTHSQPASPGASTELDKPAAAHRPLKVKIKFGSKPFKPKGSENPLQSEALKAHSELERITGTCVEDLPEALPAEWDIRPPHADLAAEQPAHAPSSPPDTDGQPCGTSSGLQPGKRRAPEPSLHARQGHGGVQQRKPSPEPELQAVPQPPSPPGQQGQQALTTQHDTLAPQTIPVGPTRDLRTADSAGSLEARKRHKGAGHAQPAGAGAHGDQQPPPSPTPPSAAPPDPAQHPGDGRRAAAQVAPVLRDAATQANLEPPHEPEDPDMALERLLDLVGELAGEDVTRGKSSEAHYAAARKYKRMGDEIREAGTSGASGELQELVTYSKAGLAFMRHGFMLEGMMTQNKCKRSQAVSFWESTAAWLNRTAVQAARGPEPARRIARLLCERLGAMAQLRAVWLSRPHLLEDCRALEAPTTPAPSPLGGSRAPSPAPQAGSPPDQAARQVQQQQQQPVPARGSKGPPPASSSADRQQAQSSKGKLPLGGPTPLAASPGSNTSTNSAASAHGLAAVGAASNAPAGAAAHAARVASSLRRVLRASEALKASSSEVAALASEVPPGLARRAAGALSLMALDGPGGDLRIALAAAARALECVCTLQRSPGGSPFAEGNWSQRAPFPARPSP